VILFEKNNFLVKNALTFHERCRATEKVIYVFSPTFKKSYQKLIHRAAEFSVISCHSAKCCAWSVSVTIYQCLRIPFWKLLR